MDDKIENISVLSTSDSLDKPNSICEKTDEILNGNTQDNLNEITHESIQNSTENVNNEGRLENFNCENSPKIRKPKTRSLSVSIGELLHQRKPKKAIHFEQSESSNVATETPSSDLNGSSSQVSSDSEEIDNNKIASRYKLYSIIYGLVIVVIGTLLPIVERAMKVIEVDTIVADNIFEIILFSVAILWFIYCFFDINLFERRRKNCNRFSQNYTHDMDNESSGLYLTVGLGLFCMASLLLNGLTLAQAFEYKGMCGSVIVFVKNFLRFIFTFIQYAFLFKNSNVVIQHNLLLSHLGIAHVIVTNMCVWYKFILEESFENIKEDEPAENKSLSLAKIIRIINFKNFNISLMDNLNTSLNNTKPGRENVKNCAQITNQVTRIIDKLNPFLHPCTIEYSIISVTIFYIIWNSIGKKNLYDSLPHNSNINYRRYSVVAVQTQIFSVDCNRAMKGLFSGILATILTIIVLIIFVVSDGGNFKGSASTENTFKVLSIYLTEGVELFLQILISIATISGFISMRKMEIINTKQHFSITLDEVLVIFGLFGVLSFGVFRILAFKFSSVTNGFTVLILVNGIVSVIQGILQTFLILGGLKKHFTNGSDMKRKKGREEITFLIIVNIALWLLYSLTRNKYASLLYNDAVSLIVYKPEYLLENQDNGALNSRTTIKDFITLLTVIDKSQFKEIIEKVENIKASVYNMENAQTVKWIIINTITYPLLLYYHYHSSCCLSNMWKSCFT